MDQEQDTNRRERIVYDTRLDQFLHQERVNLDELAEAASMSRQNLGRLRSGQTAARQDTIVRLVSALRRLLGKPVSASHLFYLGDDQDEHITKQTR
jgi:DNA-binding Xre family transcriptional regulator